ncbi:MAG: DUF3310 domain-containing protein [Proteobacteria bacterium]|nr:DUF3310 domain-containing protein [Pseudomonadota bacterium]
MKKKYKDIWICARCGTNLGTKKPTAATFHMGKCDFCGKPSAVTEPRDFGYPKLTDTSDMIIDNISHPQHYNQGKYEVWDIIANYVKDAPDGEYGYYFGNVIKYVLRHLYKGNPVGDLKKTVQYINKILTKLEEKNDK